MRIGIGVEISEPAGLGRLAALINWDPLTKKRGGDTTPARKKK